MGIEIETLKKEIQRLTRKRDAKGRFVKSVPTKREFKVGDKVRIKEWISSNTHSVISPGFVSEMDEYKGSIGTITEIFDNGNIEIEYSEWSFHPDWLEHAE